VKVIYIKDEYILVNENDRIIKKDYGYEKGVVTAALKYRYIINIGFKLPKNIEKEMLEIEAEKYLFTQGSLDYTKEYKIVYKFKEYEDYWNVEAFVVDIETLKNVFQNHLKTFKYIDFITAAPFVFESFYEITGVLPQNDMFMYLSDDEAFVSCFEDGKFLFVKSITKLSTLAKHLGIDNEELKKLLSTKGLNQDAYEDAETFQVIESFFSELFMKVSHLVNYSTGNYRLNGINHIYFYSPFEISGIEKYTDFWQLSGIKFKRYSINTEYDPFDYTAAVYNSKNYPKEEENFSIFIRPLPFYKKRTGQIAIFSLFIALVLAADIGYKYFTAKEQEKTIEVLQEKILRQQKLSNLLRKAVKKYTQKINTLQSEIINTQKQIEKISDEVTYLYNLETKKPFCRLLSENTDLLLKYNLKLLEFNKNGDHVKMKVMSNIGNSSNIAKFLKALVQKGYKNVFSKKIMSSESVYISEVDYDE